LNKVAAVEGLKAMLLDSDSPAGIKVLRPHQDQMGSRGQLTGRSLAEIRKSFKMCRG